jgi:hypothetical protein
MIWRFLQNWRSGSSAESRSFIFLKKIERAMVRFAAWPMIKRRHLAK